jgi:hypothetical protein
MLIMALIVLGIGFLQNIMNLLLDVMDSFKKFGYSINFDLSMGGLFLGSYNGKSYVHGGQWLESQAHLKRAMTNISMEGSVVAMLNIRKNLIPCAWVFGIVHPQYMKYHLVNHLCFSISLWVEGNRFGHLGVHHLP